MNPRPPFPEVLDSSIIASFKSCAQLCYKSSIQHWKPKEGHSVHLRAGGAFAHGLEAARRAFFIEGSDPLSAQARGLEALIEFYGDFECPADSEKSAERMAGALEFYFDHYPLSHDAGFPVILPGGKRAIEVNFVEPLDIMHPETGNPILYCGRGDAIISYAGDTYLCDEKTTSRLGPTWSRQWDLRGQFLGYTWGFGKSLTRIAGVLVRGVSILKTKYDTQEAICNFSEFEVNRWYMELLEWIADMKQSWASGRWRYNLDKSCADYGGCGFREVCKMQNEQPWLEQYFERRRWDPITRTETKL